jgi:hypothetical protein
MAMRHAKLDWKRELDKEELKYGVLILLLYLVAILFATSGCSRRALVKDAHEAAKRTANFASAQNPLVPVRSISGRQLTIAKHTQKKVMARHFEDDVYGVSFDFPKNYDLLEGDLPDMDRGIGYLGKIPMEFSGEGGVRLATIEIPRGAHPGTDFVNAFVTVSVFPNTTATECFTFRYLSEPKTPTQTRTIDGIEFRIQNVGATADMHQFSGKYLHGYSEESCYEIGYGVATAGFGSVDGIKKVDNQAVLQKLEKIVDSISINAPSGDATQN